MGLAIRFVEDGIACWGVRTARITGCGVVETATDLSRKQQHASTCCESFDLDHSSRFRQMSVLLLSSLSDSDSRVAFRMGSLRPLHPCGRTESLTGPGGVVTHLHSHLPRGDRSNGLSQGFTTELTILRCSCQTKS